MGKLTRISMVVFALATCVSLGMLATLWFAWDPLLPFAVWLARMGWFDAVLLVLLAIVALGVIALIIAAIAAPGSGSRLILERKGGRVEVTKDAIRSTAKRTIERHHGMSCKHVGVSIKGRKNPRINISAKVDPTTNANLAVIGSAMQREVAETLSALTGHPTESVNITFASTSDANAAARDTHAAPMPTRKQAAHSA